MRLVKAIKNPQWAIRRALNKMLTKYAHLIKNDERYLRMKWGLNMDFPLNLDNPITFSEKIQWLKLHDHNPLYSILVDKVAVKDYVRNILGEEYIIPTLGVYDRPEDIDWNELPDQFVLKCTNDSNSVVICKDKSNIDKVAVVNKFKKALRHNYYYKGREWPYKNVKGRIIAEKYIKPDPNDKELYDYKFFCFNGVVKLIQVDYNRFIHHNRNLYTPDWQRLDAEIGFPSQPGIEFKCPIVLEEAIDISQKLSVGIPHVRVDLYILGTKIYFGEMTFYHGGGLEYTKPKEFNKTIGDWIELPVINSET